MHGQHAVYLDWPPYPVSLADLSTEAGWDVKDACLFRDLHHIIKHRVRYTPLLISAFLITSLNILCVTLTSWLYSIVVVTIQLFYDLHHIKHRVCYTPLLISAFLITSLNILCVTRTFWLYSFCCGYLSACANSSGGSGGLPFEVWCRFYHPNVRDQVIARVSLVLG